MADTTAPLSYHELGNPDGPALLMVHGFLSSRHQWDLNVGRLGEHLRLVIVELLGHGDSPAPDEPTMYTARAMAAGFERIRKELDIDRWWIAAQSLGAGIAFQYVFAHPDRIAGVIATNSRAAFTKLTEREAPSFDPSDRRALPFHPIHARRIPEPLLSRMIEAADAVPDHAITHTLGHRDGWSAIDHLGELTMPLLLVNGRFERRFQPAVDDIRRLAPAMEIVHLDGGHSINIAQPAAFDDAVLTFVDRHR